MHHVTAHPFGVPAGPADHENAHRLHGGHYRFRVRTGTRLPPANGAVVGMEPDDHIGDPVACDYGTALLMQIRDAHRNCGDLPHYRPACRHRPVLSGDDHDPAAFNAASSRRARSETPAESPIVSSRPTPTATAPALTQSPARPIRTPPVGTSGKWGVVNAPRPHPDRQRKVPGLRLSPGPGC